MKTLIVYGSKYGCTENCARILSEKLDGDVELRNIKEDKAIKLDSYDKVIIGGSIIIGGIQKDIKEFCVANKDELKKKKTGLFVCCMRDGDMAQTQIKAVFPEDLLSSSIASDYFGGEFTFGKMGFFDKMIVKKVTGTKQDSSSISPERIEAFAKLINNA